MQKKQLSCILKIVLLYEIRGTIAFKKMDYYKAINQYDKALKYQINQIPSIYNKGLAYLSLRNYDEASDCFNSILELDSNNITAHLQIAEILKVKGKYKEAKERCNKVLKISPDVNSAFNKIGELNRLMSSTETYFALP